MVNVTFSNETDKNVSEKKELKKLINYAVKYLNLKDVEFGVIFVDNNKIKE